MTYVVWIAIGVAGVVFVIFAGWPLYNTYKTRGQGADVAEGQAYFKAKAKAEAASAQAGTAPAQPVPPSPQGTGQPAESRPACPPPRD